MKKIIIAIDGYSSTGKSTVAKLLADEMGYIYVDTGAMYRAVTYYALREGFIKEGFDKEALINNLPNVKLHFELDPEYGKRCIFLNNENAEGKIRNLEVSKWVSPVAAIPQVREKLVEQQQQMGMEKGLVMDGRDIGTVVFPEAELKIFMTASPEKRATRRYQELLERGEEVTYGEVLKNVQERDRIDSTREASPLQMAEGAIFFDNSNMGLHEQFERILDLAQRIISAESIKKGPKPLV